MKITKIIKENVKWSMKMQTVMAKDFLRETCV